MRFLALVVTIALLLTIPACGVFEPATPDEIGTEKDLIDAWSFVHAASGATIGYVLNSNEFEKGLGLLIGWETIEPYVWPGWDEAPRNQISDVIIGMLALSAVI